VVQVPDARAWSQVTKRIALSTRDPGSRNSLPDYFFPPLKDLKPTASVHLLYFLIASHSKIYKRSSSPLRKMH